MRNKGLKENIRLKTKEGTWRPNQEIKELYGHYSIVQDVKAQTVLWLEHDFKLPFETPMVWRFLFRQWPFLFPFWSIAEVSPSMNIRDCLNPSVALQCVTSE